MQFSSLPGMAFARAQLKRFKTSAWRRQLPNYWMFVFRIRAAKLLIGRLLSMRRTPQPILRHKLPQRFILIGRDEINPGIDRRLPAQANSSKRTEVVTGIPAFARSGSETVQRIKPNPKSK